MGSTPEKTFNTQRLETKQSINPKICTQRSVGFSEDNQTTILDTNMTRRKFIIKGLAWNGLAGFFLIEGTKNVYDSTGTKNSIKEVSTNRAGTGSVQEDYRKEVERDLRNQANREKKTGIAAIGVGVTMIGGEIYLGLRSRFKKNNSEETTVFSSQSEVDSQDQKH